MYSLSAGGDGEVTYTAPDGKKYTLDPSTAGTGWIFEREQNSGKPVIAFRRGRNGLEGELQVSLDGAPSLSATLLHSEDDVPREYYFATDIGNGRNNVLDRPAFILRLKGYTGCPVRKWAGFRIMVVE